LATVHERYRQTDRTRQDNGPIAYGEPFYKRSPKTAELIDMPFWTKTQVGPSNHVLDGVQIPQRKGAVFRGCRHCPGHSKALAIFAAAVAAAFAAKCHSIANNVVQQKGSFSVPDKRKNESGKF